jgi:hypothetical protein
METRSKGKFQSIRKSTRSAIHSDPARQAKLKAIYYSSPITIKNKKHPTIPKEETREPNTTPPEDKTSMSPIRIMNETSSTDEFNNVTPDKKQDTDAAPVLTTTSVEVTDKEVTETPEQRELRRKSHPMRDISEPLPTDCLFGRGGGTNHHPGNKLYRKMVEDKKEVYLNSKRLDKPLVAMDIIKEWRELDPPGRFLKQDDVSKLWFDVGDKKAREKTSQALREKSGKDREGEDYDKETRFESGTKLLQRGNLVTRDHSLGTEIIGNNVGFSLEGFSWDEQDNMEEAYVRDRNNNVAPPPPPIPPAHSYGGYHPHPPPPPPHHHHPSPHHPYGHPPPQHSPHHPSPHYYPPQHEYYRRPHHDRGRNNSLSMNPLPGASTSKPASDFPEELSRSSWDHAPSYSYDSRGPPPLPPPHYPYGYHHPSYPPPEWNSPPPHHHSSPRGHPAAPSPPPHGHYATRPPPQSAFAPYHDHVQAYDQMKLAGSPQDFTKIADLMGQDDEEEKTMNRSNSNSSRSIDRSNSWGGSERKHSLVLRDTSIGSFAPVDATNGDEGDEFLDETVIQRSKSMPYQSNREGGDRFPSPPQPIQTRKKPECVEKEASPVEEMDNEVEKPSLMRKISGGKLRTAPTPPMEGVVRPEPVKRETSNQPESFETKRSVKRVVLSRDKSAVSRSLKEEQSRNAESQPTRADLIDRNLSVEINKLGLGDRPISFSRLTTDQMLTSLLDDDLQDSLLEPQHLTLDDRLTTVDVVAMGIASGQRTQSCDLDEALELIMEDDKAEVDAPSAVNEDIAAKWIKGESFAEEDELS